MSITDTLESAIRSTRVIMSPLASQTTRPIPSEYRTLTGVLPPTFERGDVLTRHGDRSTAILTTQFDNLTFAQALENSLFLLDHSLKANIFFLNIDCLYKATHDSEYRAILNSAHLVLPDGIGLRLSARLWGFRLKDNCNGSDFCPELIRCAVDRGYKVFLLGGLEGVARRAAEKLTDMYPTLQIVGTQNGYFKSDQNVIDDINRSGADILLVAMGVPLQEKWIARHRDRLDARLCLGVGALLDYWSGRIRRAPPIVRKLRIEWLWRIGMEPGRLWKRYLRDDATFLMFLVRERFLVRKSAK